MDDGIDRYLGINRRDGHFLTHEIWREVNTELLYFLNEKAANRRPVCLDNQLLGQARFFQESIGSMTERLFCLRRLGTDSVCARAGRAGRSRGRTNTKVQ